MSKNGGAIAAVNHWRGQCLDNFARAEKAIISTIERLNKSEKTSPIHLHEASRNRTKNLADGLRNHWPDDEAVKSLVRALSLWEHREKERNDLVHGVFTVKSSAEADWTMVNETNEVRKNVANKRERLWTSREAAVFLEQITSERKRLEDQIKKVPKAPQ